MTWWVIVTNPACELRAVRDCFELGINAWTPTRLVRIKHRHMPRAIERAYPSFPNYGFVEPPGPADEAWHRLRAIEDVRAILTNDNRPLVISDAEMARVREHLEGIASKPVDAAIWRKDDLARITDGPWTGFEGTVADTSKLARRGSLTLLLSMFGRQTATEVSVEQLERAA